MNNRTENKPRLLDQVRDKLRLKHYSYRTEQSYIAWMKRFIFFHNKQHLDAMGKTNSGFSDALAGCTHRFGSAKIAGSTLTLPVNPELHATP